MPLDRLSTREHPAPLRSMADYPPELQSTKHISLEVISLPCRSVARGEFYRYNGEIIRIDTINGTIDSTQQGAMLGYVIVTNLTQETSQAYLLSQEWIDLLEGPVPSG